MPALADLEKDKFNAQGEVKVSGDFAVAGQTDYSATDITALGASTSLVDWVSAYHDSQLTYKYVEDWEGTQEKIVYLTHPSLGDGYKCLRLFYIHTTQNSTSVVESVNASVVDWTYDDEVQGTISLTLGTITSPAANATAGTDVCTVTITNTGAGSNTLSLSGTNASLYQLNNTTQTQTGSTLTNVLTTDTVVVETASDFTNVTYSHSLTVTLTENNFNQTASQNISTSGTEVASLGNEFFLNGQATSSSVDDFELNATNKSLIPSYQSGTNFPEVGTDDFSVSFWLKNNIGSGTGLISIFSMNASTNGVGIAIRCHNSATSPSLKIHLCSSLGDRGIFSVDIPTATVNDWNHYTFVMHSGTFSASNKPRASVNGGTLADMTFQSITGSFSASGLAGLTIANTRFSSLVYSSSTGSTSARASTHSIEIDELAFYSKRLSQTESDAVYNSGDWHNLNDLASSYNLERYFRMGDGSNDSVANTQVYDIKNTSDYIEKVGTGAHGIAQLTMNDAPYYSASGNHYYLSGHAVSTAQDDYSINGTEKSLFPSKGGGSNYFPTTTDEWSLSFWVNSVSGTTSNYAPIFQMLDGTNTQIKLYQTSKLYLSFHVSANARSLTLSASGSPLFTGQWVHCVITKSTSALSGSAMTLYVNGVSTALSPAGSVNASDFTNKSISKTTFNGSLVSAVSGSFLTRSSRKIDIDQIKSFDTELTSTQVTELYNSGSPMATSDLSFASNIDAEFLGGDGSNDSVANNQSYDIQDNTRYIEKVGTGTFGIVEH